MTFAMTSKWRGVMTASSCKPPAHQRGQQHHHGEAGIHRADDEVGREDRLLPAGHQAGGEIEADDGVHRARRAGRRAPPW